MNVFLSSLIAAALLFGACLPLQAAETVKYPADKPVFSFVLPDGWTSKPDKDGNLDVTAGDDSGFSFSLLAVKEEDISSADDAKKYLPMLAKTMAEGAELKEIKVGEVRSQESPNKIPFHHLKASGKVEGQELAITTLAFAPSEGDYYVILCAVPASVDQDHGKQMGEIIQSIAPVE